MKLTALQQDLSRALAVSSRFASSRAQLPVLTNIALNADKAKLFVLATNLEISIAYAIGAKVTEAGTIAVPARTTSDLVSNLTAETIELSAKKEKLKLTAENFSADVAGMNTADFPVVPQAVGKDVVHIPAEEFSKSISQVLFSVSRDDTRPQLTGVLFVLSEDGLTLVASDGLRLSQKKVNITGFKGDEMRLIIPKGVLGELPRLSESGGEVLFEIKKEENQVVFGLDNIILGSRVIEGEFPNFERIIPKSTKVAIHIDRDDLANAVRIASVFARESANIVKFVVKEKALEILAESPQTGSQQTEIPAKVEGGTLDISFNYRFIEEFLGAVSGKEIRIDLNDANSPGIFKDTKDEGFLHLIAPVRA